MARGGSTALSLLVSSPVPVLALAAASTPLLRSPAPRLLLADDLADQSETVVAFAFELATALEGVELHHVHVNPLTLEGLRGGLEIAAGAARAPLASGAAPESVHQALTTQLSEQLAARAAIHREYLEAASGTYVPHVIEGSVQAALADGVERIDPDVLLFGRHRAYHKRPFFLGRMPYRAMLAHGRPVIVAPDA
jgi:hypothetical protein